MKEIDKNNVIYINNPVGAVNEDVDNTINIELDVFVKGTKNIINPEHEKFYIHPFVEDIKMNIITIVDIKQHPINSIHVDCNKIHWSPLRRFNYSFIENRHFQIHIPVELEFNFDITNTNRHLIECMYLTNKIELYLKLKYKLYP